MAAQSRVNLKGEVLPEVSVVVIHVVGLGADDVGIIEVIVFIRKLFEMSVYSRDYRSCQTAQVKIAAVGKAEVLEGIVYAHRDKGDIGVKLIYFLDHRIVVFLKLLISSCKGRGYKSCELCHLADALAVFNEFAESRSERAAVVEEVLNILEGIVVCILGHLTKDNVQGEREHIV